jgi:hypothetical protein
VKILLMNCFDCSQVDSECGKSLPQRMLSTPILSRICTPRSSAIFVALRAITGLRTRWWPATYRLLKVNTEEE